jgi:beta-lactamase regulating signal transducer with metallopeptidase domain
MNIDAIAQSKLIADIGWTLAHSIWQIGVVSLVLFLLLHLLRDRAGEPALRCVGRGSDPCDSTSLRDLRSNLVPSRDSNSFRSASEEMRATPTFAPEGRTDEEMRSANGVALADSRSASGSQFVTSVRNCSARISMLSCHSLFCSGLLCRFLSLRLLGGFSHLRNYRYRFSTEPDEFWIEKFSALAETLRVKQTVGLLRSELVHTPIAIGILKPVIVIPASLFLQISPHELETILAHELIHIRRYDPLVNVAQCVIESIFFYHPGVWWISAQIRREREFAADASVIETFENSHVMYARALANLEEIRLRANQQTPRYATAANGGNFMQRIQRILKIKTEAGTANSAWTAGVALLLTSAFLLAVFSFSSSDVVNAQKKSSNRKLAIGFVPINPLDRTANAPKDSDATARLLIQKLKEYKVPGDRFS